MQDKSIVSFSQVDKEDGALVGAKGVNLGELVKINVPIPNGFIITAKAYFENLENSRALDRIRGILFDLDIENPTQLESKAKACQEEIRKITIEPILEKKLYKFYQELSGKYDVYVTLRSSAAAEDLPEASFAIQQSTFLNIKGNKDLKNALLNAWASLFEARAIYYRVQQNFDHFKAGIAVFVQKMVQSQTSGVMFTIDPITSNKSKIIIESIFGLGELIIGTRETPDRYEVSKSSFEIIKKTISAQQKQLINSKGGKKLLAVSKAHKKDQKLPDEFIVELAKIGAKIEKHYFSPQDIEWAFENNQLYIIQTRPVTAIKEKGDEKQLENKVSERADDILLQGAPASPVIGTGRVVLVPSAKNISKIQKGDVLVTEMTNPNFVSAMKKAAGIVTNRGGITSHAAIVSREFGIACVVGTKKATSILKEGMVVTVDGAHGIVYLGQSIKSKKNLDLGKKQEEYKQFKTATSLYVNLAQPELAGEVASKNVDGVGLLRAEFILAQIGTHPKKFLEDGKGEDFVEHLAEKLAVFGKAFGARPVIYRATNLKSNEYANLKGGQRYEPTESNPMLGYRGAIRYIKEPDVFKLELEAIKRVRQKHQNLHLMIPYVRTVNELKTVKKIVEDYQLFKDPHFKFYMMVELPTNVILLEDYIAVGIDGVSIGSNDLTMLILGTDRNNEEVSGEFRQLDPAVLWALKHTIKTAANNGTASSICHQGSSVYPELAKMLVSWGITSISVNPDAIDLTRQYIYEAEHTILNNN